MKTLALFGFAAFACIHVSAQTDSAQTYFKQANNEVAAKHFLIAAKLFDKAISFNPKFTEAYIENAKANLEMHKVDAALVNFAKAYELQPSNALAIKELSSLYFNNRQFQKALDMVAQCKDCQDAERIMGMSYYQIEDYGQAVTGLKKAIAKNPADAEAIYTLARTYLELEQERDAIPYYQKAVELDSTKNVWMYELALMYYNMDRFMDAVKYFTKASNAGYPKSNDFYENSGFAFLYSRDIDNGMKNLNIVLSRKPNNSTLITDIAQAMYQAQRYDDALVYYQKLLDMNQKDSKALYMAGITLQKKGQKEKGQAMCDQAIAMDPSLANNRQKKGDQFGL